MRASRTTTLIATIALSATLAACGGTAQSPELAESSAAATTSVAADSAAGSATDSAVGSPSAEDSAGVAGSAAGLAGAAGSAAGSTNSAADSTSSAGSAADSSTSAGAAASSTSVADSAAGSSAASTTSVTDSAASATSASTKPPEADAEIEAATTVAYLGPAGTYTEEAAKLFFGEGDELMPQASVEEALTLVTDGTAAYAVIPQENALGGPVTDYIDALLGTDGVSVVGEVVLPIRQTLMGKPGTDLAQVKRVLSHKQGLAQSAEWLSEHLPDAKREEAASTAAAAQAVAEGNDSTTVAIAAPGAAELYGLEVLQDNVSLSDANKTRFYVVARDANELVGYQYAAFVADIMADELPRLLEEACAGGAKLVCVHDRPDGSALGSYRYVIELEQADGFSADELARLKKVEVLNYLGSYARVEG